MKVTKNLKPEKSQVELNVEVEAVAFKTFLDKAAKKISAEHQIKGFRPGKAPISVIADAVGTDHLLHEAMDMALPSLFVSAALEHDVEAINRPAITVEELGLATPFRFTAVVDVLPQITLGDVKKIKAEKKIVEVTPEAIEKELQYIAKTRSQYVDVARPAEKGDVVTVDFLITMNGAPMEGGESKNHPITIGDGHFVPEFEQGLTGLTVGETRTFPINFPADFPKEDMRGKKADAKVTAHAVQKRVLPELNDDFAKSLGKFADMKALKDELSKNMLVELTIKEEERYLSELAEKLAEVSSYGFIPDILIEKEIDARLEEFSQMLAYQQKTVDDYLTSSKKTLQDVREEMRPAAVKHVQVGLAMRAFAKQHGIEASEEEVMEKANQHLAAYKTVPQAKAEVDLEDLKDRVESTIKNQKTLKKLAELVGWVRILSN